MKFGGQTSKNVHDVWKVCLKMTLGLLACFVKFYIFILDDINVGGLKLVYEHIRVINIRASIPKDYPRVLEKGPFIWAKDV